METSIEEPSYKKQAEQVINAILDKHDIETIKTIRSIKILMESGLVPDKTGPQALQIIIEALENNIKNKDLLVAKT